MNKRYLLGVFGLTCIAFTISTLLNSLLPADINNAVVRFFGSVLGLYLVLQIGKKL